MPIDDGNQQRSSTVRPNLIYVRSCCEQNADDIQIAYPSRKHQRCESTVRLCVNVRSMFDQRGGGLCVSLSHCPHQGGLSVPVFLGVHGRFMCEQCLYRIDIPSPRGQHERGLPMPY